MAKENASDMATIAAAFVVDAVAPMFVRQHDLRQRGTALRDQTLRARWARVGTRASSRRDSLDCSCRQSKRQKSLFVDVTLR
jgi:23S rRNA maturation mini-RNase III